VEASASLPYLGGSLSLRLPGGPGVVNEKTIVEHYLEFKGLQGVFLPKFHCELNPIERVWGQAKVYTRIHTNFTLVRMRKIIDPALDSVSTENTAEEAGSMKRLIWKGKMLENK
jgi:hypothetical protein